MASRYWIVQGNSQENPDFAYERLYAINTTAGAVDLDTSFIAGGMGIDFWIGQQSAVIAALRSTGTNIVSLRAAITTVPIFENVYGSSYDAWETAVKNYCAALMQHNCFLCVITALFSDDAGDATYNHFINAECNRRMRLWGNSYYHGLADFAADPTYGVYPPPPGMLSDFTHWTEPVHIQMETIIRPVLDGFPPRRRSRWRNL